MKKRFELITVMQSTDRLETVLSLLSAKQELWQKPFLPSTWWPSRSISNEHLKQGFHSL